MSSDLRGTSAPKATGGSSVAAPQPQPQPNVRYSQINRNRKPHHQTLNRNRRRHLDSLVLLLLNRHWEPLPLHQRQVQKPNLSGAQQPTTRNPSDKSQGPSQAPPKPQQTSTQQAKAPVDASQPQQQSPQKPQTTSQS
ncbi:hypothetical protein BC829DRAFT_429088 [Chytridium lagenaria]|nr:hypothetical protein BC829DRAFT_429088 [Chytridium lagenaria]